MTHITDTQMEAFCARAGNGSGMESTTEHLANCLSCQALFQNTLKKKQEARRLSISLHPEDWYRLEHLGYDQLESYARNKSNADERAVVALHLGACSLCREDLRGYYKLNNLPVPAPLFVSSSTPQSAPVRPGPTPATPPPPVVKPEVPAPPPAPLNVTAPIPQKVSTKKLTSDKVVTPAPVAVAEAVIAPAPPPPPPVGVSRSVVVPAPPPPPPNVVSESVIAPAPPPTPPVAAIEVHTAVPVPLEQTSDPAPQTYSSPRRSAGRGKAAYVMAAMLMLCVGMIGAALFSWSGLLARQLTGDAKSETTRSEANPANAAPSISNAQPANSGSFELKDGDRSFQIDAAGSITGIEGFPAETQTSIREALSTGALKRPAVLNELAGGQIAQSGGLTINYPRRVVILEDKPMFRWAPVKDAAGYQIQVNNLDGARVAESGPLAPTATQWSPLEPLKRGVVYSWSLTATLHGEESAPSIDAEARFKILDRAKLNEHSALKSPSPSHLALGVFYAREGLLIDARRELQALAKENPGSPLPDQLIRSLQGRK
jgi:hypothetical protein